MPHVLVSGGFSGMFDDYCAKSLWEITTVGKKRFCLFQFFPNLLSIEKKNENALKHVSLSSKCTRHIQAGDIKVFCLS